jgi:ribosomal-protein-alanine N-acetyltransferase
MTEQFDGLRLERGDTAHIAALIELERHCFGAAWTAEQYRNSLSRDGVCLFMAWSADRPVAYGILETIYDEGHIPSLGVIAPCRRHGIGTRVLDELLAEAMRRQLNAVLLEVRRANQAARSMYAASGFELVGVRREYYWDPPDDALVMRLRMPTV